MNQRTVTRILLVYWLIGLVAVVLRIDRFPLTWAPMYSVFTPRKSEVMMTNHIDKKRLKTHGFRATQRDGTTRWVSQRDLNVRSSSMRRMYNRRAAGGGSAPYNHLNHDSGTIDRWLWGLEPGEHFEYVDWKRRLIVSVNKTLGLEPASPQFIVRLEASWERYVFHLESREQLESVFVEHVVEWDEAWNQDY